VASPKDDCLIASTIMGLTARTMGLETTYIGFLETSSKSSEAVKKELDLPEGHEVFSVIIMGYPKYNYVRTVDRRRIETRWK
jgi:nitroreductase